MTGVWSALKGIVPWEFARKNVAVSTTSETCISRSEVGSRFTSRNVIGMYSILWFPIDSLLALPGH